MCFVQSYLCVIWRAYITKSSSKRNDRSEYFTIIIFTEKIRIFFFALVLLTSTYNIPVAHAPNVCMNFQITMYFGNLWGSSMIKAFSCSFYLWNIARQRNVPHLYTATHGWLKHKSDRWKHYNTEITQLNNVETFCFTHSWHLIHPLTTLVS